MALSRDQVVATAMALLDEVGLEGLTLRRLAQELGVRAPTLYWHVRDKRELLDLMAAAIHADSHGASLEPRPGQPWWEWLTERTQAQFDAVVGHRDGARVLAGNRPTAEALPASERVVGTLVHAGFPPDEALGTILLLGHYVIGCAVEYQAEAARTRPDLDAALLHRLTEADDLPVLKAAVTAHVEGSGELAGRAGSFEHGLRLLVAGLRVRHAELEGARPAATVTDA
ncbi:MAG: TetR/AcrR family transcriptional regulator C-terminal domain-containing protein [Actinomycetes bacterium]